MKWELEKYIVCAFRFCVILILNFISYICIRRCQDRFVCVCKNASLYMRLYSYNQWACVRAMLMPRPTDSTICQSISTTHVRLGSLTHSLLTITLPRIFHLYCEIAVDFNVDVAKDYVLLTPKVFRCSALSNKSSSFLFCVFFFRISVDRRYHLWFFFSFSAWIYLSLLRDLN